MATVLIVDDDPSSRAILRNILENLGYTALEASDGRSAIQVYRAHLPNVVLLDMIMPERDGFETLFDLRNIDREAKIIMMTGGGRIAIDLYSQLAHSLHIPQLLIKPFSAEVVAKAIAEVLNHQEPANDTLLREEA